MTAPRTLLADIIASARPNQLITDLAADAQAARPAEVDRDALLAESNRIARIADALAAKGESETAVHLYQDAIALLTAA
ncbi:hypothetical protein AB0F88_39935 [Streptosporangium sp. NPDC023963]|uniref:hypothetical protein n=1 Tax=Streptosporangium sp. NPDC023963 TaxID=3155608 RepID=UPI0034248097